MQITHPAFTIKPIDHNSEQDVQAIFEVYRQCEDFLALGPVATASMQMVQADLKLSTDEGGIFCGIYHPQNQVMMGIIDVVLSGYEGRADEAYLALLMIAAPYRSHGLGEAVVKAVEVEIRRNDHVKLFRAGVQVNNPGAIRFWQRMGFQIVSGPKEMPDGTTCYDLLKTL